MLRVIAPPLNTYASSFILFTCASTIPRHGTFPLTIITGDRLRSILFFFIRPPYALKPMFAKKRYLIFSGHSIPLALATQNNVDVRDSFKTRPRFFHKRYAFRSRHDFGVSVCETPKTTVYRYSRIDRTDDHNLVKKPI